MLRRFCALAFAPHKAAHLTFERSQVKKVGPTKYKPLRVVLLLHSSGRFHFSRGGRVALRRCSAPADPPPLLVTQRHHGIYFHGAASREITREACHDHDYGGDDGDGQSIGRLDLIEQGAHQLTEDEGE
jgi:hypothetical protein